MSERPFGFVQTKSSLLKKNVSENFKVITYESHKAKPKKPNLEQQPEIKDIPSTQQYEWDMKKARHEIFKFGMSGFDPTKKLEAKIQLAIKLGAKPPRNKNKNYKKMQEEKKKEIKTQTEQLAFDQLGKNQLGKSTTKTKFFKKKKATTGLLDHYGKASAAKTSINEITKRKK